MLCCLFCVSFIQLADDCCLASWYTWKKSCRFCLFSCFTRSSDWQQKFLVTWNWKENFRSLRILITISTHVRCPRDGGGKDVVVVVSFRDRSLSCRGFVFLYRLRSLLLLLMDVVVLVASFLYWCCCCDTTLAAGDVFFFILLLLVCLLACWLMLLI